MIKRQLNWEGCHNVRDLGGLTGQNGRKIRPRALVRSDTPAKLTPAGWDALTAYGIRTIISLTTEGIEDKAFDLSACPTSITAVSIPIEDINDQEFLERWAKTNLWGTPLYFQDALRRWPTRHKNVVETFAQAQEGGVLIHCARGHDRTGIATLLLLTLAGVSASQIADDYLLSKDEKREELLTTYDTTSREVIEQTVAKLPVVDYLLRSGLSEITLTLARNRLLEPIV